MRGWLIDIYADDASNSMVYWLRTRRGAERVVDRAFLPRIYVHSSPERLSELEGALPILDAVEAVGRENKRIWLGEEPREVLAVTIGRYSKVEDVAHTIDNRGRYRDYTLFDVDMRFSQRYLLEKGVFPMGLMELSPEPRMLDDPYAIDYELPPLSSAVLAVRSDARRGIPSMDDRLVSAEVAGHAVDGNEEDVIRGIADILSREDPDVVYTDGGDAFAVPFLYRRAKDLGMRPPRLGRDDGAAKERKGKSYFSYGRILYKPPTHPFRGRIHIDRASSFMFIESGLNGLTDLSRISGVPVQELSRLSPGSAISAMEVNQAIKDGCAVMWKKNLPEDFKTAQELIVSDRGGFIYEPKVGLHERVLEVDFTSLYPNIMVRFNISPETVMCGCCEEPSRRVPVLGYGICDRQVGLIPRVLKPVVERRTRLKRLVRAGTGDTKVYKERVSILKWLLVTCLDAETPVPHLRDGRYDVRPIGDIVDPIAGGRCGEFRAHGLKAFGVDRSLTPCVKDVTSVFRHRAPERMVEAEADGHKLRLTPDHPCYIWERGGLVVRHAASLRKGDMLPVLMPLYDSKTAAGEFVSSVQVETIRMVRPRSDHVYCIGVDGEPHGFALDGGVLTHNCFGYTGYRNARFGRIECHEAINAYGRELMLQASEIAEAHGYEILHGIVDSLWLKGDGDPERFCEHVSGHTGIPLEPEGVYKWIVFLPDRAHGLGVLNRYYGLFEDGKAKVRGIELRRKDTTGIVRDMQSDLLTHFSRADDAAGFTESIPAAMDIVGEYVEAVRSGTVPLDKLLVTRRVSQGLSEYRQFNDGVAALSQLDTEGFEVHPGEAVRYVMQDRSSKDPSTRVKVEAFLGPGDRYDEEAYVDLVLRGAEGMLLPFGLDLPRLRGLFPRGGREGTLRRLF